MVLGNKKAAELELIERIKRKLMLPINDEQIIRDILNKIVVQPDKTANIPKKRLLITKPVAVLKQELKPLKITLLASFPPSFPPTFKTPGNINQVSSHAKC